MKALILSDIHSNAEALKAIWSAEGSGCDVICAAGDYVDYGTHPAEAVEWMMAHGAKCVLGNHDATILEAWKEGNFHDVSDGSLTWAQHNCQRLSPEHIRFLRNLLTHLSFELDDVQYLVQHSYGAGYDTIGNLYQFDQYWNRHRTLRVSPGSRRCMVFGHTHQQGIHLLSDDAMWINPGSVSYRRPDDPSKDAYYMTVTDGIISMKHIAYDRAPLQAELRAVEKKLQPRELAVARFFFEQSAGDGPMQA